MPNNLKYSIAIVVLVFMMCSILVWHYNNPRGQGVNQSSYQYVPIFVGSDGGYYYQYGTTNPMYYQYYSNNAPIRTPVSDSRVVSLPRGGSWSPSSSVPIVKGYIKEEEKVDKEGKPEEIEGQEQGTEELKPDNPAPYNSDPEAEENQPRVQPEENKREPETPSEPPSDTQEPSSSDSSSSSSSDSSNGE